MGGHLLAGTKKVSVWDILGGDLIWDPGIQRQQHQHLGKRAGKRRAQPPSEASPFPPSSGQRWQLDSLPQY